MSVTLTAAKSNEHAESEWHSEIGARLIQAREERGLTQQEVCKIAGITQRTLWSYENGAWKRVPAENLRKLAKLYHVNYDWVLWGEQGDPDRPDRRARERAADLEHRIDLMERLLRTMASSIGVDPDDLAERSDS